MSLSRIDLGLAAALALATIFAYFPTLSNDFVPFDDVTYVLENPQVKAGLTHDSILWAFSTTHGGNWHPLAWLSHMLDVQIFGLNPVGHHASSLMLHLVNTLLVFGVLLAMTRERWPSFAVAALFGLHPLHVESVAWVSERKDVLSCLFWLLTMAAYVSYARKPSWTRYVAGLFMFSLGLAAKSMLVTLPFVLLLADYWPLQRCKDGEVRWPRLFGEKAPYFLLAALFSLLAVIAQGRNNAINPLETVSLSLRLSNAATAYVAYIAKTFDPRHLVFLYPFPTSIPAWKTAGAVIFLSAASLAAFLGRRRRPSLFVGWFWYLGSLAPVIGLVQIGVQAMADRYTYIPSIGLGIALVWGVAHALAATPRFKIWGALAAAALALCLITLTRQQVGVWKDGIALFSHALAVMPEHAIARYNLAGVYATRGDYHAAIEHLRVYVQADPWDGDALALFADALLRVGRYEEAIPVLTQQLRATGENSRIYANLAQAFSALQQHEHAAAALAAARALEKAGQP